MSLISQLDEAVEAVQRKTTIAPLVGVVLGSGLGAWAESLSESIAIPYAEIPSMPVSTVVGHPGKLWLGLSNGVPVACLQGRVHLYEGHSPERVVFGARLLARLGCRAVLLTNAAGGTRPSFQPGDLMLITDHLNLTGQNPLVGPNEAALGPRFPDMTTAYDRRLCAIARESASESGVELREGVYAGLLGPTYETPAEIQMLRTLGADAVGMSTVHEVIALRHMGVRCAGISCVTNLAAGMSGAPLDHREVEEVARRTRDAFAALVSAWVRRVGAAIAGSASFRGGAA
jgi:purine-nucleoside phosphorylase